MALQVFEIKKFIWRWQTEAEAPVCCRKWLRWSPGLVLLLLIKLILMTGVCTCTSLSDCFLTHFLCLQLLANLLSELFRWLQNLLAWFHNYIVMVIWSYYYCFSKDPPTFDLSSKVASYCNKYNMNLMPVSLSFLNKPPGNSGTCLIDFDST